MGSLLVRLSNTLVYDGTEWALSWSGSLLVRLSNTYSLKHFPPNEKGDSLTIFGHGLGTKLQSAAIHTPSIPRGRALEPESEALLRKEHDRA